ncbi:MAG: hypothetical protein NC117_09445 [Pseudoflavonifractor sp.]|nr:hypothetical protein [Pseudoflavonifractor sp.]
MALFKNEDEREIETLEKLEHKIAKRERRERINHMIIAGLGAIAVLAFIGGHICGYQSHKKRTRL